MTLLLIGILIGVVLGFIAGFIQCGLVFKRNYNLQKKIDREIDDLHK